MTRNSKMSAVCPVTGKQLMENEMCFTLLFLFVTFPCVKRTNKKIQIGKHKYTNTQIQHMTKCQSQKDQTCGKFLKRRLFKDMNNYIPVCQTHKWKYLRLNRLNRLLHSPTKVYLPFIWCILGLENVFPCQWGRDEKKGQCMSSSLTESSPNQPWSSPLSNDVYNICWTQYWSHRNIDVLMISLVAESPDSYM